MIRNVEKEGWVLIPDEIMPKDAIPGKPYQKITKSPGATQTIRIGKKNLFNKG